MTPPGTASRSAGARELAEQILSKTWQFCSTTRHLDDGRGGPGVQQWSGAGRQGCDDGAGGKDAEGWVSENAVNRSTIIDSVSWFGTQVTSA